MRLTSSMNSMLKGGLGFLAITLCTLCPLTTVQAQGHHAKISAEQAKATALKRYPGHVVGKVNLENEEGSWQYAVNVRSGKKLREVMVNAKTGKIASVEVTSKAEEAREQRAEAAKRTHAHHDMSHK